MRTAAVLAIINACFVAAQEQLQVVELPASDRTTTRIIGGKPTSIDRYPYTVQVLQQFRQTCGGTLVTQRHVLSAAHCFVDLEQGVQPVVSRFTARVGSSFLNTGGTVHTIHSIVIHPRYNVPLRDSDVAVMVLRSAVRLTSSVAVASIPVPTAVVPDNASVVLVGWGRTNTEAQAPVLQSAQVRKVNRDVCVRRYAQLEAVALEPFPVTDNMICAGLLGTGGKDACQGDSGGPMIYSGVVVGVTSWGLGCGEPEFPGVSARVAKYTKWIQNVVREESNAAGSAFVRRSFSFIIIVVIIVRMLY